MNDSHMHQYLLEEAQELMDDFGYDAQTALELAHEFMQQSGRSHANSPEEFLGTPLPGCEHCAN